MKMSFACRFSSLRAHRRPLVAFVSTVLLAANLLVGCASQTDQTPDKAPVEADAPVASFSPAELFSAHAAWMPPDTLAVAVGDPSVLLAFVKSTFPAGDTGAKHYQSMLDDFDQLFTERIGFDPSAADAIIVGGSQRWQVAIFHGDVSHHLSGGETHQSSGLTAYKLDFGELANRKNLPPVWAVALEESAGLAFFPTKQAFEAAAAAHAGQADNLSSGAARETFDRLLSQTDGDKFALAANLSPKFQRMLASQLPFPSPQAGLFGFGDEVSVELIGEKKSLDGIETLVEQFRAKMLDQAEAAYAQRATLATAEAAGVVASYHMLQSYDAAFGAERGEDSIAYSMAIPRDQFNVAVIGIGAAIAIPAFIKYIKRSKASESTAILRRLEDKARMFYAQSGDDGDCNFPPSAGPTPPKKSCCAYNPDSAGGAKCPANPQWWDEPGWKALDFSLNDPTYFAYEIINQSEEIGDDTLVLRAYADFSCGGPMHTVEVTVVGKRSEDGTCSAVAMPRIVTDEFE